MTSLPLFAAGADSVGEVRDPLDRHYTPDPLALLLVRVLQVTCVPPGVVVEPSAGGGAFVERWRHLMDGAARPAQVYPICPRPWSDHVRETALYVWRGGPTPGHTVVGTALEWR